jgi:nitroreductase
MNVINKVIDTIMNRRSVRVYEARPIPRDVLETLIEAGNMAPTGGNVQNWRFVVVESDEFRKKLLALGIPRYRKWMERAPESLVEMRKEIDEKVSDPLYYDAPAIVFVIGWGGTGGLDTPMVCENIMLAARSLGIGSCWVYFGQLPLDDPEIQAALEMKEGEQVYGPILLGYPRAGEFPASPPKKKPVVKWI